jgi:hypothetical protein
MNMEEENNKERGLKSLKIQTNRKRDKQSDKSKCQNNIGSGVKGGGND